MESFQECIVFLLAKAYQRSHAVIKDRLKPFDLTPVQQLILAALEEEDGLAACELGRRLGLDGATLSGVLERMADKGWVLKTDDPMDRRLVRISLSPRARRLCPEVVLAREAANQEILEGLSLEERVLLKRLLKDIRTRTPL